tara:strand:+ start:228 stop:635 length:408 start_codon:yes stop_codon:yes gene_type:complete
MEIKNMRKPNEDGQWGKVKAFFDVANAGFEMKGFRLIEGINGLFVSMPSRKGTDQDGNDKWFDTVWIESQDLREKLNQEAINSYNSGSSQPSQYTSSGDNQSSVKNDEAAGNNLKDDSVENDSSEPAFSDDDIPF